MIYQTGLGMVDAVGKTIDYIDSDAAIQTNIPTREILITSSDDLENLTDYPVGSIAYTAGLTAIYVYSANGNWVAIGTEEEIEEEAVGAGEG